MTPIVMGYLALGAINGAILYVILNSAIKNRQEALPEEAAALGKIEHSASVTPGGMATLLLVMVAFWPVFLGLLLLAQLKSVRRG